MKVVIAMPPAFSEKFKNMKKKKENIFILTEIVGNEKKINSIENQLFQKKMTFWLK